MSDKRDASALVRGAAGAARCSQDRDLCEVRRVVAGNYLSPERVIPFQQPNLAHLIDTAIMSCELLIQLIANERFDEQRKGLLG